MARLVKVFKTLRNNWKKTVFGTIALTYGVQYGLHSYECRQMMRAYCEAAREIGETAMPADTRPRHVTVVLNPAANKRKAKKEFDEYCAPLLHLAGLSVNLLVTVKEGQARTLVEKLEEATDAIIVAGGDGTLSEASFIFLSSSFLSSSLQNLTVHFLPFKAVTGLFRRPDGFDTARKIPFGVLPLGKTNSVAKHLFSESADDHIRHLAEATMAVIFEVTRPLDVIKFQVIPTNKSVNDEGKPVYGLVGLEWGAFRDANARKDKYWYFGGLKSYASYIFTGLKDESKGVTWKAQANVEYTKPCEGCSKCYGERFDLHPEKALSKSWWSSFGKRQPGPTTKNFDYRQKLNEECNQVNLMPVKTTDFSLLSTNVLNNVDSKVPHLKLSYGPEEFSYEDFIKEGFRRENGESPLRTASILAKEVKLYPIESSAQFNLPESIDNNEGEGKEVKKEVERWISIDNEDYEVKAVHALLLPNLIKVFGPLKGQIN
ncbi:Acylglycerol kinase, mitochondrial [Frankliniella fusca]|uniref:Acylglycerol kinase, mitochondrial n=1 Tax=Frankliniella fusca TaxID=407009 RepID=A0AAE1GTK5_9NEOP|nr:Acylglycerol kinase, mitochondrial [Frankliniella fusca]